MGARRSRECKREGNFEIMARARNTDMGILVEEVVVG
jgi:hypothetical protein